MLCTKNGWTVRYVVNSGITAQNPTASLSWEDAMAKCHGADGYFVDLIDNFEEVNCLYISRPANVAEYGTSSPEGLDYLVSPSIYRWVLQTTSSPLQIPPTGMNVDSVHFEPACAESGCWVIKGTVATGEAFNSFGAFNSFYLPQTNIKWSDVWNTDGCDASFARANTSGICWKGYTTSLPFAEAEAQCAAIGGRLATIKGNEENDRLKNLAVTLNLGTIWIGLTDSELEGSFMWSDGTEGPNNCSSEMYQNWAGLNENTRLCREPNDCQTCHNPPGEPGEDCTEFVTDGSWNDNLCSGTRRFVCEVQAPDAWPDPQQALSYDFDYGHVEWTYAPALHPCTSATYDAGSDSTDKISTCCITNPEIAEGGGFVANYRPTQSFVDWAGTLHCDVSFNRNGSTYCWEYYLDYVSYGDAVDRCEAVGGYPAMILSEEENRLMWNNLCEPDLLGCGQGVWLGFTDVASEGNFTWVSSNNTHNSTYTNWGNNEPNDNGDGEDCTEFWASGGASREGFWNDRKCSNSLRYVCEFAQPIFENECVKHIVQRPDYTTPKSDVPCWMVQTQSLNFVDAEAKCAEKGGHVASIRDNEENWFFRRVMGYKGVTGNIWLGFTDNENISSSASEENFVWTDGSPVSYTNWANNEPNDWGPGEDCTFTGRTGLWNDISCANRARFACQYERDGTEGENGMCHSDEVQNLDPDFDITFPSRRSQFLNPGKFKGMTASPGVVDLTNLDPFFGQYSFEIHLDEVELRSKAGKLKGTVGVEHTVDTYLGLANFRPTGLPVLDTFAIQTNIHLEKTSFFTVSTHGTNDYTFLEYVNMRLVQILWEDDDFSGEQDSNGMGDSEAADRTVRTATSDNMVYIQVTFTLGDKFNVNSNPNNDIFSSGLIPLDSVRVGLGTFLAEVEAADEMEHTCQTYAAGNSTTLIGLSYEGTQPEKGRFNDALEQPCAPQSTMCASPSDIPDQFVSFNIPLGSMVLDNKASNTLSNNIFVDMVINAIDEEARAGADPGAGENPWQVKTTLTASIPIVDGGINIFCDGIVAKTDLKDVANADIIVGSAKNGNELTRLRIIKDIASTDLASVESAQIDTDSIESALLTLVLKGQSSYFDNGVVNSQGFSMELDDLITIHLMEDGEATTVATSTKEAEVVRLLGLPADDNQDANGLDTDGYFLNGAFRFTINRGTARASLHPTSALLAECPFNPPRPAAGNSPLETCIVRRDVRERGYPTRTGAGGPTAMEILPETSTTFDGIAAEYDALENQYTGGTAEDCTCTSLSCCEAGFLQGILGANDYARDLAVDFVKTIHGDYNLNGRYTRAYWINPGYEWTPTQTNGRSIFSVSQKIYLFALITLDENWTPTARRRMLLQTSSSLDQVLAGAPAGPAGPGGAKMEFSVSPKSLLTSAFNVPIDRVAKYNVELQITNAEACMSPADRQAALRTVLETYLEKTASPIHTVQVTAMTLNLGDEVCSNGRRNLRKLLNSRVMSSASVVVDMLVVFKEGTTSKFNVEAFQNMEGVIGEVTADASNSPKIDEDAGFVATPAPSEAGGGGGGMDAALIGGIAGGVGGAVLLAGGAVLMMRSTKKDVDVGQPVQALNVHDLKAQLETDA